jgi:hypothetical protein
MAASWPVAFLWTCALELPVYTLLVGRRLRHWWSVCVLTLGLQLATHPALWWLFPRLRPGAFTLLAAEGLVVLVEAALLAQVLSRAMPAREAMRTGSVAALAANVFSTVVGLVFA